MDRMIRLVRNATFVLLLMGAALAMERKVFAASCSSYSIGFESVWDGTLWPIHL